MISILIKKNHFVTVFAVIINKVNSEVYTSITDMENLLKYECFFIKYLNNFISKQVLMLKLKTS